MMTTSESMTETGGARTQRVDERLGEFGARIRNLEERDRAIEEQFREVRAQLSRIEAASARGGHGNSSTELLMNRVLDVLAKPPAPPPPAPPAPADIASALAEAMRAKRATDPLAAVGYVLGGGSLGGLIMWGVLTLRTLAGV